MHVELTPAARIILELYVPPSPADNEDSFTHDSPFSTIRTLANAPFYNNYDDEHDPFLPSPDEFFEDNPLLAATLQTQTQRRYATALRNFLGSIPVKDAIPLSIDHRLSIYIQQGFLKNPRPCHRQEMANLLSMILVMHPNLRHELGLARMCIAGWKALKPSRAAAPLTTTLVHAFAYHMLRNRRVASATTLLVSYFGCLRVSEALHLQWDHIALPGDLRLASYEEGIAGLNIVDAKTSRYTGRLQFVKLSNPSAISYLQHFHAAYPSTDFIALVSYSVYNSHLKHTAAHFGFQDVFSSHSARIGKATEDFLQGIPPHEIAIQGRWKSINSLRYYLTNGKAWIMDNNVTADNQARIQTAANRFLHLLAVSHSPHKSVHQTSI